MTEFTFFVPGKPTAKARHRTGRTKDGELVQYKDRESEVAEMEVRRRWELAGGVKLDGPIELMISILHKRPHGHRNKSGLSAEGLRHPIPTTKPDIDNVLKNIMDSLNQHGWDDDKQVVNVTMRRRWGKNGVQGIRVTASELDLDG